VLLDRDRFSVVINGAQPAVCKVPLLRKICFGGLYEPPEWPQGMWRSNEIRLDLDSITLESPRE
jgi:hypothetical protein